MPTPNSVYRSGTKDITGPDRSPHDLLPPQPTYTVIQAAALLGIGRTLAYQSCRDGSIPAIRVGRRLLVPRAALARLLIGEASTS